MAYGVSETFLGKIPVLNLIEKLRVKVVEWVHKDETKGTEADFVVKAGVVGAVGFLAGISTLGTVFYNLISPHNTALAYMLALATGGLGYKYFTERNIGRYGKTEKYNVPALFIASIAVVVLSGFGSPIFSAISGFIAQLIGGVNFFHTAQSLLTASSLVIKSKAATLLMPLLTPVKAMWAVIYGKYLADLLEYIYFEIAGK